MKRIVVAFAGLAVAGIAVVAGFVAGARWANTENLRTSYELGAYEAAGNARFLALARAGKAQVTTQYFEDRIDNAFVNLTYSRFELSPRARAELKVAADYRQQFPNTKKNSEHDARVQRGMLQAR